MSSSRPAITTPAPWRWWHVVGLWSLVVAQPVYDVLRQNGDFFVAHRVSPLELILFVLVVSAVLPAFVALAVGTLSRASIRVGHAVQLGVVGGLVAALASQVLLKLPPMGLVPHLAVAAGLGVLGATLYARSSGVRGSLSLLTLAVPVFAGLFLFHPAMAPFIRPIDRTAQASAPVPPGSPPIVMVVFDQLPLASLMRPDGTIDAQHYPGFASLAAGSTWYPNATTTGDLTGWALPALMSGVLPRNGRLPIAEAHPQNLFTVLGDSYRLEVTEPITKLCPERLCPDDHRSTAADLFSMTLDAAVVYAHVVTPRELRDRLPALTNDWRDFIQSEHWQWRWIRARDADRREPVLRFVDSIDGDEPQPTLYFLHALLPHEPYIYTRTGQQFTDEPRMRGMMPGERWTREEWPVTLAYTRHLLQLEYVDALVQRLLAKLRDEGLYDDALVIVTSDHGASFRPGHPWKAIDSTTLPDIMAVPLFIKAPGQKEGRVDTGNIQSIDVLPTVADLLNVPLRREVEGVSRLTAHDDARKTIRYMGARRELSVDTADHARALREAVARRWTLFPDGVSPVPRNVARDLLGRLAPGAGSLSAAGLQVLLEQPQLWQHVTPSAEMLPLRLVGRVFDGQGRPAAATLAVAVNGTIRAVTRTFDAPDGDGTSGHWTAYLRPDAVHAGRNLVQVFVVPERGDSLQLAYSSAGRPLSLNLSSRAAADFWGVVQRGLYNRDDAADVPYRWTNGEAAIVASMDVEPRPQSLRVGLAGPPLDKGPVQIRIDDCVMYGGPVDSRPWYRTFSLDACPALASKADATVVIRSGTVTGTDGQQRGVQLETVDLFPMPWPVPTSNPRELRAEVRVYTEHTALARSTPVRVDVRNVGNAPWVGAATDPAPQADIGVQLQWRSASSAVVDRTQMLRIPRVMYPGDRLPVEIPLVPPPAVDGPGPWDVAFVPVTIDGQEIPGRTPGLLHVTAAEPGSTR